MKESESFDNILDECLERLLGGETIEQCLQNYPEQADELEPLLQTALSVKKASTVQPRAEFRARARYQFQSALQEIESRRGFRFFAWQPRWATAVAVVLIILLLGGGTVAAAGNSMPDEILYPVKLATERVRLALTPSALSKAELYIKLADKRVEEIIYAANKGDSQQVELAAQRLDAHLMSIAALAAVPKEEASVMLAPAPAAEPEPAPPPVPAPAAVPAPAQAREVPQAVPPKADKQATLKVVVKRNAMKNPNRLRAALETAPESVKPALRKAIRISEAGYEGALKSIEGGKGD